jgi:uncharacterized protein (UPF0303 family)
MTWPYARPAALAAFRRQRGPAAVSGGTICAKCPDPGGAFRVARVIVKDRVTSDCEDLSRCPGSGQRGWERVRRINQRRRGVVVFTRFDNADAWRLGSAMVGAAIERMLPVTVDIRRHGQQLFHAALPGTTAENDSWIERKVNVVNRFSAASYLVGRRLAARGTMLDEALGVEPRLFAAHGGAFPIRIKDVGVVGTVTVSGLPQADDHAFVTEMIGAFLGV